MKKTLAKIVPFTLVVLLTLFLVSCSKEDKNENKLYLYNWTYYTPESVIEQFEKE